MRDDTTSTASIVAQFTEQYRLPLDPDNRWIKLGACLPWSSLIQIVERTYAEHGRPALAPRMLIAAMIVKHQLRLTVGCVI